MGEADAAVGEAVQRRRQPFGIAVAAEPIGAQRVHHDHHDVGRFRRLGPARTDRERDQSEENGHPHRAHHEDTASMRSPMQPWGVHGGLALRELRTNPRCEARDKGQGLGQGRGTQPSYCVAQRAPRR